MSTQVCTHLVVLSGLLGISSGSFVKVAIAARLSLAQGKDICGACKGMPT